MIYIGIDPGINGAIAFLDTEIGHLSVVDMPILEVKRNNKVKKEVSSYGLSNIFDLTDGPAWNIREVVLERVGAMPGQGVSSVFSFGRSVGLGGGAAGAGAPPGDAGGVNPTPPAPPPAQTPAAAAGCSPIPPFATP